MINTVVEKCDRFRVLLDMIQQLMSEITPENFDESMAEIIACQSEITSLKDSLAKEHSRDELEEFNLEVIERSKQIQQIYDNTVSIWKSDVSLVKSELEMLQNQKKLSRYQR